MEVTELLGLVTCLAAVVLSTNGPQSIVVSGHGIDDVIHPGHEDRPSSLQRQRRSDVNANGTTIIPTELPTDNFRSSTSSNTTASVSSFTTVNQTVAITTSSFISTSTTTSNVSSSSANASISSVRTTRFVTSTPNITSNSNNSTTSSTVRASTGVGSYASITNPKSTTSQRSTSTSKAMLSTTSTSTTTAKPSALRETSTDLPSISSPSSPTSVADRSTRLLRMTRSTNLPPTNAVPTTPSMANQTTLPPVNATTWGYYDQEGLSDFQKTVMIVSFSIIGVLFIAGFIVRIWNRWNKAQLERRENEREWRRKSHKNAQFERRASGASRTSSVNSRQGVRGDKPVTVDTVALETTKIPDVEDNHPYTVMPQLHIPDQCVINGSEPVSAHAQTQPDESAYYAKASEDAQEEPAESSETESMADAKRRVDSLRDDTSPLLRRDSNQVSVAKDNKDASSVSKDSVRAAQRNPSREHRTKLDDLTKKKDLGSMIDSKIDEAPKRERIPSSSDVKVRSLHFPAKSPGSARDPKMSVPEGPKWLYHHGSLPLDMKKLPPEFFEELGISPQALFEPVERLNLQEIWKPVRRPPASPTDGKGSFRRSLAENLPPEHEDREVLKDTYEDETGMMSTEL